MLVYNNTNLNKEVNKPESNFSSFDNFNKRAIPKVEKH